jgi:hypothetical protein
MALALGSLQRAFLPAHPRLWQYGVEVTMRGFSSQAFKVNGQEYRVSVDLVRHRARLDGQSWPLDECDGRRLLEQFRLWLAGRAADIKLEEPKFSGSGDFNPEQAAAYAQALWWLDEQFRQLKTEITTGVTSPVLLYPHHFDLALSWFPHDDERQLSIGWSTGDVSLPEPYIYLTAYPESPEFKKLELPRGAHWQTKGFSGAVLPYVALQTGSRPAELFKQFAGNLL